MNHTEILGQLADAVLNLQESRARSLTQQALDQGMSAAVILNEGLSVGMRKVGEQFNAGEMFMPEVLVACDVYFAGLELIRPLLVAGSASNTVATMVLGSIHGDIHTVGKNVAIPVFEANGIRVIDVGTSVDDQVFVDAIRQHRPQIVGLGTYMTSTFMHTRETVNAIAAAGLREQVKIICGGPAVDGDAARRMGADDASDDAWQAVEKIKRLAAELGR